MAVQLRLVTFVTNAGVPVTGLAGANIPEIEIWNAGTGAVVQASTDTTEIAGGFYRFNFTPVAGTDYVALFDRDPAAIGQVTPQERYASLPFSEFIDDIVPEGGSEDYGVKLQRLDAAITTRAAPGDAMDLVANAVDAASVAVGAIEADAFAAGAIDAAAIGTDAIDADAIAANAIGAAEIANGAIDAATFAAGAIDAAAIAPAAIDAATFAAGAIDSAAIATDAIGSAELATSAVNEIRDAILSDSIPFDGALINASISSRATQASLDVVDQNVDDLEEAMIAAQLAATAGSTSTEIRTGATQANNFYDDMTIVVVNSAGVAARRISSYANTNGAFTVAALPFTPSVSDPVIVINRITTDLTDVENTVWDAAKAAHVAVGSFGEEVQSHAQPGDAMDLVANAVDAAAIATGAIDADAIAANAIGASELATDAIGADQLAASGVNEIRDSILDDAIRFSGGDIDVAISSRNAVTPLLNTTDQAEHDATQVAIAALQDLSASQAEDAVWDALRSAHTDVASFGQFTGDATMRGTDGANTTVPLAAAADTAAHDQTQTDIAALNDLDIADVQTALTNQGYTSGRAVLLDNLDAAITAIPAAVWALTTTGNQAVTSFGKALTRLFGDDTRTKLFFAVSTISTGGREVPASAISHMEVQVRDDGGAFPGVSYFVVFGYNSGDAATDPPRSSNTAAAAPTDGSFTSTEFPT